MPILMPKLTPTITPYPVGLGNSMMQPDFYAQQRQVQAQQNAAQQSSGDTSYDNPPITGDLIKQQLASLSQRKAVPHLDPNARVHNTDASVYDPAGFNAYYQQLGTINQTGKSALQAQQNAAAFAEQKRIQDIVNQSIQNPIIGTSSTGQYVGGVGSGIGKSTGSVPSSPKANFQYAQNIAGNYGWGSPGELGAWYQLGMNESGWNNNAQNKTSTAYGIGQFLDSTWGGYGIAKTSDPSQQVEAMARYIRSRYGSPSKALAAWNSRSPHWY